ncbi:hypothetical protein OG894_24750 [Streptomyces sp. NBC_01724]|uniref:hypothetical protein n=1 Tax=unclassified Streptomyces TaxID=2593676 RepID=UPI0028C3ED68|nr:MULTISPECIES: hypothetical protein [unclassified Streptomyces]WNO65429.1 hypothetical protein RPQ02_17305 [Streptomyces sp. AM2-3-1]WSC69980.1 hypothetical protein OG807_16845 [Streptomyces sp. NBC_01760]WTI87869.1 hypothetical protein OHB17_17595 [Streptomyces sp. NBC_00724]
MAGDLQFTWELYSTGWATCRIADSSSERKDAVGYGTDALADLLRQATRRGASAR